MENNFDILKPTASDIKMLVLAEAQLSARKCEPGMGTYVYGKSEGGGDKTFSSTGGNCVIDLQKTWDKLVLAARVLAAVEDPRSIYCVGQRPYAQRAIIKFAKEIGATAAPGRFTPGQFTNQVTQQFVEPRILVVADPRTDSQAIKESSYVNIPVIAFCGSDSPLAYVDIAIPGNNRGKESLGCLYWMLAREVKRIGAQLPRELPWEIKVDLFIYREPEEIDRQQEEQKALEEDAYDEFDQMEYNDGQQFYDGAEQGQNFEQNWDQDANNQEWAQQGAPPPVGGPQAMHGNITGDWNDAGQFNAAPQQSYQQPQQQAYQQPQQGYQQGFQQPQQGYQQQPQQGGLDEWDEN